MIRLAFSYDQIHDTIVSSIDKILYFRPTMIVAIGGGGWIPGRIIRSSLREKLDKGINMYGISVELYNDKTNKQNEKLKRIQWFDDPSILKGQRILLVDEVDDTRKTLQYCVEELRKYDIDDIAVFVIHNKVKDKIGKLDEDTTYFAGENIPDKWVDYPWEKTTTVNKTK